jgi:hypothetical protein
MNTRAHSIPISTSKKLSRLDLEIYEINHQECLVIDEDIISY